MYKCDIKIKRLEFEIRITWGLTCNAKKKKKELIPEEEEEEDKFSFWYEKIGVSSTQKRKWN